MKEMMCGLVLACLSQVNAIALGWEPHIPEFMDEVEGDSYRIDHHEQVAWNYDETDTSYGPSAWGLTSTGFGKCIRGKRQSPIDLNKSLRVNSDAFGLSFDFTDPQAKFYNNGRFLQVDYDNEINLVRLMSRNQTKTFKLKTIELHSPSEHAIKGRKYAMELQLQLTNVVNDLDKLYLGVFLKKGDTENKFLARFFDHPLPDPAAAGTPGGGMFKIAIDPKLAVPKGQGYVSYHGSQTKPPCAEVVNWVVFLESLPISHQQLSMFRNKFARSTARPLQALNDREPELIPE